MCGDIELKLVMDCGCTCDYPKTHSNENNYSVQLAVAEEKTAGGLYLTDASKEKPSIGTVSCFI